MVETKKTLRREAVTGGIFDCRYDKSLTLTQATVCSGCWA